MINNNNSFIKVGEIPYKSVYLLLFENIEIFYLAFYNPENAIRYMNVIYAMLLCFCDSFNEEIGTVYG